MFSIESREQVIDYKAQRKHRMVALKRDILKIEHRI